MAIGHFLKIFAYICKEWEIDGHQIFRHLKILK